MSQKKRSDKNSVTAAVEGFRGVMSSVPLPQGIELRSDEEMVIWDQFTRARAREDWRDMDLILLAKVVRMEADIRKHQSAVEIEGVIVENQDPEADISGVVVTELDLTGLAAMAGIIKGDVIYSIGGTRLKNVEGFKSALQKLEYGKYTRIGVSRDGNQRILSLKLTK